MAVRRELFEQFCAPFVRAQTDQNFTWFLFVDTDIPQDEADALAEIGGCTIVRCASQTDGINKIRSQISEGFSFALTARLDSDDSIASNYVELMRRHAERNVMNALEGGGLVLCFGDGAEHDTVGQEWFERYYPNNPFIGLLEPIVQDRPARMIFHHAHYDMCRHFDSLTVKTPEPLWCIRVHGGNVANQVKGASSNTASASFALGAGAVSQESQLSI